MVYKECDLLLERNKFGVFFEKILCEVVEYLFIYLSDILEEELEIYYLC